MSKYNDTTNLQQYVKNLNIVSGQFNLYICLCHKKRKPDMEKLKSEIKKIKQIVASIEDEIESL